MSSKPDNKDNGQPWVNNPTSAHGCDLTQIRDLLALSPTDRARALQRAVYNLMRASRLARRV